MSKSADVSALRHCACFHVRRFSRAITQFFDAEVRRHGLRPTQTPVLGALAAREWTMAELSEWLGMERTTLLRNLRPLQRDGLIRIKGGGRGSHVELAITEKGRNALAKLLPAWQSAQQKVVATLGQKRWDALMNDLEEIEAALREL